ncbi:MAG: glycine cleavage system protein GcvH [Deltaproteobacteria bacterium]|nr:glycine cleavage system protein GcvH [Deltaproteobacteria bacterium]
MSIPNDLRYTEEHEWARVEGTSATVGITHHAQEALGDIVFVDLPEVGRQIKKGEAIGAVESVKAVSDLFSPLSGKVVAVNTELTNLPDAVNKEPYGAGWMVKVELSAPAEVDQLLSADAYQGLLAKEAK